jgi:hypothetical protein
MAKKYNNFRFGKNTLVETRFIASNVILDIILAIILAIRRDKSRLYPISDSKDSKRFQNQHSNLLKNANSNKTSRRKIPLIFSYAKKNKTCEYTIS